MKDAPKAGRSNTVGRCLKHVQVHVTGGHTCVRTCSSCTNSADCRYSKEAVQEVPNGFSGKRHGRVCSVCTRLSLM
jgi:hypothetical protein